MSQISEAWLKRLLEALAEGPIGEEILGVARGECDLVVKENQFGAGWIVSTTPKPTTLPQRYDWRELYGPLTKDAAATTHVGRTVGG